MPACNFWSLGESHCATASYSGFAAQQDRDSGGGCFFVSAETLRTLYGYAPRDGLEFFWNS